MNANTKILALMVALTVGSASAEYTQAGETIRNTATATYTDPSDPNTTVPPVPSNEVTTTVLAKPGFDVIFKDNSPTDGGTQNALSSTTSILTGSLSTTTSTNFVSAYTVKNDGNIALKVDIAADTTGATGTQTVSYYLDVNKDRQLDSGDTPLTDTNNDADKKVDVTVAWDDPGTSADEGLTQILQVITIAAKQDPSKIYGASPVGTVVGTGTGVGQNGYANVGGNGEDNNAANDLQYSKVQLYSLNNTPNDPTTTTPLTPGGTPYTPTGNTKVDVPTLTPGNTDDTINTPPTQSESGYKDPGNTPIIPDLSGNTQVAYPKADSAATDPTNAPDSVTFTNTLKNTGSAPDAVQLFPSGAVDSTGTLTGWTFDASTATFTNTTTGVKVQFLDPSGTALTVPTGATYPGFTTPAGSAVYYQTKVTYPDPDDSAAISAINVVVAADSLNDTDFTPNATTTNVIYPAAAQFGDNTTPVGTANATPKPVQTVTPYGNFAAVTGTPATLQTSPDVTDGTAVFTMDLVNNGQYNDSFLLSAAVKDSTGTATGMTVKYYDALTGVELNKDGNGKYVTPVVAKGAEYKVLAVINVTQGTFNDDYTVDQSATGNYSSIPMSDTDNIIRVARPGAVGVAKFIAQTGAASETISRNGINITGGAGFTSTTSGATTAKPGENIVYKIIAKNTYPLAVKSFLLSDNIPTNTEFVSASVSGVTGAKVMYKASATGTWTVLNASSGTFTASTGTTVYAVAVDINGDDKIDASDELPSGTELTLNLTVSIK